LLFLLLFLSAAHAVWFQTPITHKYHVVGVGFGRIAPAIQDSVSGGKAPCEMAFFAAIRRTNVSLMPLLYKTEVRAEGQRAASSAAVGATSHYEHSTVPGREEPGPPRGDWRVWCVWIVHPLLVLLGPM
jgi:hypothetical protein